MLKKYIVRLTDGERETLKQIVAKLKGTSQKVRRAQVLLKADADGLGWTDAKIAEAFGCRTKTVENIRQRLVTKGFEMTLDGQPRLKPPREKLLDGEQRTKIDWAIEVEELLRTRYVSADKVILVCDNLNTHTKGAFTCRRAILELGHVFAEQTEPPSASAAHAAPSSGPGSRATSRPL